MIKDHNEELYQGAQLRRSPRSSTKDSFQGALRSNEEHEESAKDLDQGAQQGALRSAAKEESG